MLERKLTFAEKAQIKMATEKLNHLDEFKVKEQVNSQPVPIAETIITEEDTP